MPFFSNSCFDSVVVLHLQVFFIYINETLDLLRRTFMHSKFTTIAQCLSRFYCFVLSMPLTHFTPLVSLCLVSLLMSCLMVTTSKQYCFTFLFFLLVFTSIYVICCLQICTMQPQSVASESLVWNGAITVVIRVGVGIKKEVGSIGTETEVMMANSYFYANGMVWSLHPHCWGSKAMQAKDKVLHTSLSLCKQAAICIE